MSRKKRNDGGNLVWSDQRGGDVRSGGQEAPRRARGDGIVRVRRETKGRGGKTITAIDGVALASDALKDLAKDLKQRCGTGGAVKDGVIEIQGDHRDVIVQALEERGYTVKRAGG